MTKSRAFLDLVPTLSALSISTPLSSASAVRACSFETDMEDRAPEERLLAFGLGDAIDKDGGSISSKISSIIFNGRDERANFVL